MTGIEALEAIKNGQAVRGIKWNPTIYIFLDERGVVMDSKGYPASLRSNAFLEDDWELYDESVVGTRMEVVLENKIYKIRNEIKELHRQIDDKTNDLKETILSLSDYRGGLNGNK